MVGRGVGKKWTINPFRLIREKNEVLNIIVLGWKIAINKKGVGF